MLVVCRSEREKFEFVVAEKNLLGFRILVSGELGVSGRDCC